MLPMLLFLIFYIIWFRAVETGAAGTAYHMIYSRVDSMIPFCEYFIVPYYLWFLYVPAFLFYVLWTDDELYSRTSFLLMSGMLLFLVISTVYPTMIDLRPDELPRENVFTYLVSRLYEADTPTNVLPSIHVYNTLVGFWSICSCNQKSRRGLIFRRGMLILGLLIIASTMFLKQHSVCDVLAAGIMFALLYGTLRAAYFVTGRDRKWYLRHQQQGVLTK